jgi:predicted nucleic acid-binding Zn ribbon protein
MEKINQSLTYFFSRNKYQQKKIVESSFVYAAYPHAVGEILARSTRILAFKKGLLTVACKNSIFVTELNQMKELMINKMNEVLQQDIIQDVRFVIGNVRPVSVRKKKKQLRRVQKEWIERVVKDAPECYRDQVRSMLTAYKEKTNE